MLHVNIRLPSKTQIGFVLDSYKKVDFLISWNLEIVK